MKHRPFAAALLALAVSGCASGPAIGPNTNIPVLTSASADLRDATGRSIGTATLSQVGDAVRLVVDGVKLPMGAHGIHIHQTGVCAAPDFLAAGPHWNPSKRRHGKDNSAGMHRGDLPNILIGANGAGSMEYTIPTTRLAGTPISILDSDGAALIVHAVADDHRTDPSGNSGGRIACGVFR